MTKKSPKTKKGKSLISHRKAAESSPGKDKPNLAQEIESALEKPIKPTRRAAVHPCRLLRNAKWSDVPLDHGAGAECLVTSLFHFLWLKTPTFIYEAEKRASEDEPIAIPDTVIFDPKVPNEDESSELSPSVWYFTSVEDGSIRRKGFKRHNQVRQAMERVGPDFRFKQSDIAAQWVCQQPLKKKDESDSEDAQDEQDRRDSMFYEIGEIEEEEVEQACLLEHNYLDSMGLGAYTSGKREIRGQKAILQKFIHPQGEHNEVYRVEWTNGKTKIQRSFNSSSLYQPAVPAGERAQTFGLRGVMNTPSAVTVDVRGKVLSDRVQELCQKVVKQVFRVSDGNLKIHKVRLYLKLGAQNRLWLLFCDKLQFRDDLPQIHQLRLKKEEETAEERNEGEDEIGSARSRPVDSFVCPKCKLNIMIPEVYATPIGNVIADFDRMCELQSQHPDLIVGSEADSSVQLDATKNSRTRLLERLLAEEQARQRKNQLQANKTELEITIPPTVRLLYPYMSLEEYKVKKTDQKFLLTTIELCQDCFLTVRDAGREGRAIRRAKKKPETTGYPKKKKRSKTKKRYSTFALDKLSLTTDFEAHDNEESKERSAQDAIPGIDDREYIYAEELGLTVENEEPREEPKWSSSDEDYLSEENNSVSSDEETFSGYAGRVVAGFGHEDEIQLQEQLAANIYSKVTANVLASSYTARTEHQFPKIQRRPAAQLAMSKSAKNLSVLPDQRILRTRVSRKIGRKPWDMTHINPKSDLNLHRTTNKGLQALYDRSALTKQSYENEDKTKTYYMNETDYKWLSRDVESNVRAISSLISRSSSAPTLGVRARTKANQRQGHGQRPKESRRKNGGWAEGSMVHPQPLAKNRRRKKKVMRAAKTDRKSTPQRATTMLQRPGSVRDLRARDLNSRELVNTPVRAVYIRK